MQCKGKKRYDEIGAKVEISYMQHKFKQSFRAYKCPACGYWHIGHPEKFDFYSSHEKTN